MLKYGNVFSHALTEHGSVHKSPRVDLGELKTTDSLSFYHLSHSSCTSTIHPPSSPHLRFSLQTPDLKFPSAHTDLEKDVIECSWNS